MFSSEGIGVLYRKIRGSDDFASLMNRVFQNFNLRELQDESDH